MSINFFIYSAVINASIAGLLGVVIILKNRKELINRLFFGLSISVVFWALSYWQWMSSDSAESALFFVRLLSIGSLFIPIFYFHWIIAFVNKDKAKKNFIRILYLITLFILPFSFSKIFVSGVESKFIFQFWPNAGPLYTFYLLFIYLGLTIYALLILFDKYRKIGGPEKLSIKYVIWGSLIGFAGGATNFFLWYDVPIFPYGNIFVSLYPIVLFIAIFKYQLFDVKVVTTELLTFTTWILIFIRTLIADTLKDRLINGGLLILLIIVGIWLITSVMREVKQREEIEKVSKSLEEANVNLSIRTKYLQTLQDFTTSIIENLDFKSTIQAIVNGVSNRFGYLGALLILVGDDNDKVYPAAISQSPASRVALKIIPKPLEEYFEFKRDRNSSLTIQALKTGEIQFSNDFSNLFNALPKDILRIIQKTTGIKMSIAIPIKSKGRILGALDVFTAKSREYISQEEIDILRTLANQIGIILDNASLFEETKRLSAYKTELLSIVAHQLKNPLVVVKGYSSLVEDGTIQGESQMKEVFKKIKVSADKLVTLLNNLLDLHHIEDGKMHYEFQQLELNKLLGDIAENFQIVLKQKNLEMKVEKLKKDALVNADIYKLSQVFQNLIDNAIKYTDTGWVNVKIEEDGKNYIVRISDSGRGISAELLPKLFQKFIRGVEERQILGTGLGLYISREIVDAHQGKIWAESEGEGKGSAFLVKLPKG